MLKSEKAGPVTYAPPDEPPLPMAVAGNSCPRLGPVVPRRIEHEHAATRAAQLVETDDDPGLLHLEEKYNGASFTT